MGRIRLYFVLWAVVVLVALRIVIEIWKNSRSKKAQDLSAFELDIQLEADDLHPALLKAPLAV